MTKTRFTPWVVLACIGALAGCTSGEDGTVGNTELNVLIPSGSSQSGPGAPSAFDIQVVEYSIQCADGIDFDPTTDPDIDSGPTLNNDVRIDGVLEVLDSASAGVNTQDFGPDLDEVYVWQGFMDLPVTGNPNCIVELRAKDIDGEVICTSYETFGIQADQTTKVNVLMFCDISYQAPVGMLDLDGDFSFNVSNYCPDLFVLNCIDTELDIVPTPIGDLAATACQVRFRDADLTCGQSCDPQTCDFSTIPAVCTQGPDPGEPTTVVSCDAPLACAGPGPTFGNPCATDTDCGYPAGSGVCVPGTFMSCNGLGPSATGNCTFNGDTLGDPGAGAPGAGAPGNGGWFVFCTTADNDGNPSTPAQPILPGATITCTANTTDGDQDCNKTKTVDVVCPGLTKCQTFAAAGGTCDDGSICTADSCNDATCDGATAATCCDNTPANENADCSSENPPVAICVAGVCTSQACTTDAECDDGNPCTTPSTCNVGTGLCSPTIGEPVNTPCTTPSIADGVCNASNVCIEVVCNIDADCDDSNECTTDSCDTVPVGNACVNNGVPNEGDGCTAASGPGFCESGVCIGAAPDLPAATNAVPNACIVGGAGAGAVVELPFAVTMNPEPIESGSSVNVTLDGVVGDVSQTFLQGAIFAIPSLEVALINSNTRVTVGIASGGTGPDQELNVVASPTVTVPLESSNGAPGNPAGTYNCYQTIAPGFDEFVIPLVLTGTKACGASCGNPPTICAGAGRPLVTAPSTVTFTGPASTASYNVTDPNGGEICFQTVGPDVNDPLFPGSSPTDPTYLDVAIITGILEAPITCGPGTLGGTTPETTVPLTPAQQLCFPVGP